MTLDFLDFRQTGGKLSELIQNLFLETIETAILPKFNINAQLDLADKKMSLVYDRVNEELAGK